MRIKEFVTHIEITESIGPLSAEELKKIVTLVFENIQKEQDRLDLRNRATQINDRVFP